MEFKNLFTMKQPQLGQKILELRKLKGLTQEELVEQCNINVRTIQRIEAGEVSPRSYTIKTILEVLGQKPDDFFTEVNKNKVPLEQNEKRVIFKSAIAASVLAASLIIYIVIETFLKLDHLDSMSSKFIFRAFINLIMVVAVFYYLKSYSTLGSKLGLTSMKIAIKTYFIIEVFVAALTVFLTLIEESQELLFLLILSIITIIFGVGELVLGLSIQKLKSHFGTFPQIIGIGKMINGICLILVILSPISLVITVPLFITEAFFLYQVSEESYS